MQDLGVRGRHEVRPLLAGAIIAAILAVLLVQTPAASASAEVSHAGPRDSGGVALTFDDGWGEASCERIASTLRREGVVGTFFINGAHLRADPARWRRILRGMPVANHTRSHANLETASSALIRRQIQTNEWIHRRVLGRLPTKILRPPYGAYDGQVLREAHSLGYRHVVLWSRTAADTSPAATVTSILRHATGGQRGDIILMHCARDVTATALPAIIRHYKQRGIRLIGLDEMFRLPIRR
jgi:peptidoglycan/xylan/chitin deacetylase (PgdA/CDA1 family)